MGYPSISPKATPLLTIPVVYEELHIPTASAILAANTSAVDLTSWADMPPSEDRFVQAMPRISSCLVAATLQALFPPSGSSGAALIDQPPPRHLRGAHGVRGWQSAN
jgi:hypothetical protein